MPSRPRLQRGFTLIELLVTVAVLVIVLAIVAPSMREFATRNQLASSREALSAALSLARMEAARRGVPVMLVAASGAAADNRLGKGWSLYLDQDADGALSDAERAAPLRAYEAPAADVRVDGEPSIAFNARGALAGGAVATYEVCPVPAAKGYQVVVEPSGIANVSDTDDCS